MNKIDYTSDDYHKSRHPDFFENQELSTAWSHFVKHTFCWNAQTIHNLTSLVGFETKRINFEYYDMRRKLLPLFRLCADKSEAVVRYTLSEDNEQIFASKYMLYLPTEQELKNEIYSVINE